MLATPSQDYRRSDLRPPAPPLAGLDAAVNHVIGRFRRRHQVLEGGNEAGALTDAALQRRLLEFRERFRRGGRAAGDAVLPAFTALREAADRTLGLRPFGVQIMGALALHRGFLAEMATGEGKTLTAGLAAILAGWTRQPCHVVTINDYLVERDARWLQPLYHFCGVRVGWVAGPHPPAERVKQYGCDVTYVTSKELLADFLRDRLQLGNRPQPTRRLIRRMLLPPQPPGADGLVLRGLHAAIVDEADSILIDEAVTPLIIAAPHANPSLGEAVQHARRLAQPLASGEDYHARARHKEIELTPAGLQKLARETARLPGLWRGQDRRLELVIQALVAREFFHRDQQYIIEDQKLVIVDEFTGRPMPQRTWREGMHQAIEAKEGLNISDPTETIARLSFQRFFRCFRRLSGMTGTAREAAGELWQVYGLPTLAIPPNRPCVRQRLPDRYFPDDDTKWQAVAAEVEQVHHTGRPLLVGTRSVLASEHLWQALAARGLTARILNATRLKEEAEVIALAGERGRITIATNMAGRGTDIKLGSGVAALGGLHVIATERYESGRVDRQLFGRAARQGDPGSVQAFVGAEDELLRKHLPRPLQEIFRRTAPGRPVSRWLVDRAQHKAQALAYRQRQAVMRSDLWVDQALSFTGADTV